MAGMIEEDIIMTGTSERIFYPGKYYVATADNKIIMAKDKMSDINRQGLSDTDVILIAVAVNSQTKTATHKKTVNKIIIDFDKKLLTIDGEPVTLYNVEYDTGETELDDYDLKDWDKLLADARKICSDVVVKGTPPIDGEDITNEMSDL